MVSSGVWSGGIGWQDWFTALPASMPQELSRRRVWRLWNIRRYNPWPPSAKSGTCVPDLIRGLGGSELLQQMQILLDPPAGEPVAFHGNLGACPVRSFIGG
jgi:hypothetical protein